MRSGEVGIGAAYLGDARSFFRVWAPFARRVDVRILGPGERHVELERTERGYHEGVIDRAPPGSLYLYRLDLGVELPDPASRSQPLGIHEASEIVDSEFPWLDAGWRGVPLEEYVLYEIHVGTFTPGGTFDSAADRLDDLQELGITAIELMPLAQFPGSRNWGYDGVHPFAVQNTYGGPLGLKRLVDACHRRGIAVVLDVVYNHLGPEGNYLGRFGPYFTDTYRTPWGSAINFDGPHSDEVRRFFIENALYWFKEFHIDAIRLDAVHAIKDFSARPFLEELAVATRKTASQAGKLFHLIAESDRNDARITRPRELGGLGIDAQWSDDFHHSLHALLTGERNGYYQDFGDLEQLARAHREGFVYTGQYSRHRKRSHGNSTEAASFRQFVVCAQNHDQVGNRMMGERLTQLVGFEALKLAAGCVVLSPFIPLLFMGEEHGETAPFQYFVSHSDPALIEAVRQGRRKEFEAFGWKGEVPDPQDKATFLRSRLCHELRSRPQHSVLREYYREIIGLRKTVLRPGRDSLELSTAQQANILTVRHRQERKEAVLVYNFGEGPVTASLEFAGGRWVKRLDSSETRWMGPGTSLPCLLEDIGRVDLTMTGRALCLFVRVPES